LQSAEWNAGALDGKEREGCRGQRRGELPRTTEPPRTTNGRQPIKPCCTQKHALTPPDPTGDDPNDCPRDLPKADALRIGCNNAETPDKYNHYRCGARNEDALASPLQAPILP